MKVYAKNATRGANCYAANLWPLEYSRSKSFHCEHHVFYPYKFLKIFEEAKAKRTPFGMFGINYILFFIIQIKCNRCIIKESLRANEIVGKFLRTLIRVSLGDNKTKFIIINLIIYYFFQVLIKWSDEFDCFQVQRDIYNRAHDIIKERCYKRLNKSLNPWYLDSMEAPNCSPNCSIIN